MTERKVVLAGFKQSAIAGDNEEAQAGDYGFAYSGVKGRSSAGEFGFVCSKQGGVLELQHYHTGLREYVTKKEVVGERDIKPDTWYQLDKSGVFIEIDADRVSIMMDETVKHGTYYGYNMQKCRCRACKDANATYNRKLRNLHKGYVDLEWQEEPSLTLDERIAVAVERSRKQSCGNPGVERYLQGCRCEDCNYVIAAYHKRQARKRLSA